MIVCGWHTPDYTPWAQALKANLSSLGLPHDIVPVAPRNGSWAQTTLSKAQHVRSAINRHPGKAVVFLDVDCEVMCRDKLIELTQIPGDVGFYLRTKFKRSGGSRMGTRSGTMVFKPTVGARAFVRKWVELSQTAPRGSVDQDSLAVALGRVPECLVSFIDKRYCAVATDQLPDPWILHSCASASIKEPSSFSRLVSATMNLMI